MKRHRIALATLHFLIETQYRAHMFRTRIGMHKTSRRANGLSWLPIFARQTASRGSQPARQPVNQPASQSRREKVNRCKFSILNYTFLLLIFARPVPPGLAWPGQALAWQRRKKSVRSFFFFFSFICFICCFFFVRFICRKPATEPRFQCQEPLNFLFVFCA